MQRPLFTVLTIFSALIALEACAHHGPGGFRMGGPGGPEMHGPPEGLQLKPFVSDGDGKLTRDELDRALHAEFAKYDADHDGVLNTIETRALNDKRRAAGYGVSPVFDWNGDGHVDFNEFANQCVSLFERLDTDNDGVLTQEEMTRPPMGPRGGSPGGGRQRGGRDGPPGGGGR